MALWRKGRYAITLQQKSKEMNKPNIEQVEFKIVQNVDPWDMKPGEAIEVDRAGKPGLILCCPACGKVASGGHKWNAETKTLTPSIVHNAEGCGWHGYLTNGKFSNA